MSSIVRWEPARDMMSLREAMDKLFEESFVNPLRAGWAPGEAASLAVDMYETGENVVVMASVPGIKAEDIDVTLTGDVLIISGETKSDETVEQEKYLRRERRYGRFERTLQLPVPVQADKIEATFENGVLTLTLPKVEEQKPKLIKINVK